MGVVVNGYWTQVCTLQCQQHLMVTFLLFAYCNNCYNVDSHKLFNNVAPSQGRTEEVLCYLKQHQYDVLFPLCFGFYRNSILVTK